MKYLTFIAGTVIIGIGIAINNWAALGVDPMSVVSVGLSSHIGVSLGIANAIISLLQLALTYFLDRRNFSLASVLSMFAITGGIELFNLLPLRPLEGLIRYAVLAIGILVYSFGVALSLQPGCGKSAYDGLVFTFVDLYDSSYRNVRLIIDGVYLITGYALGGTVGIATVIIVLTAGTIIQFFLNLFNGRQKA